MALIVIDKEKIRTLLDVLEQTEYAFSTSSNVWVTDRPELVPDNIKFELDFSNIAELINEQISLWGELVGNCTSDSNDEDEMESNADNDEFIYISQGLKQALELVRELPSRKHNERTQS